MRQGLFPICIVCAVIAVSPPKIFDKSSIATEKSFCNSKGVHSRSKQGETITVTVEGEDETVAAEEIAAFLNENV